VRGILKGVCRESVVPQWKIYGIYIYDSSPKQNKVVIVEVIVILAKIRPLEPAHVTFRIIFAKGFYCIDRVSNVKMQSQHFLVMTSYNC